MYGPIGVEIIKEISDEKLQQNAAAELRQLRQFLGQALGLSQPEPEPAPVSKNRKATAGGKLTTGTMQRR